MCSVHLKKYPILLTCIRQSTMVLKLVFERVPTFQFILKKKSKFFFNLLALLNSRADISSEDCWRIGCLLKFLAETIVLDASHRDIEDRDKLIVSPCIL